jgi:hypothetical protein
MATKTTRTSRRQQPRTLRELHSSIPKGSTMTRQQAQQALARAAALFATELAIPPLKARYRVIDVGPSALTRRRKGNRLAAIGDALTVSESQRDKRDIAIPLWRLRAHACPSDATVRA